MVQSLCSSCSLVTLMIELLSVDVNNVIGFVQHSESLAESLLFQMLPFEVCKHAYHTAWSAVAIVVEDIACSSMLHFFQCC